MAKIENTYLLDKFDKYGRLCTQKTVDFTTDEEKEFLMREFEAIGLMRTGYFLPIYNITFEENRIIVDYEKCHINLYGVIENLKSSGEYLSEKGILVIFLPILKAIYSIHLKSFIHRNITKQKIYVDSTGNIVVGGLELMRRIDHNVNITNIDFIHLPKEALFRKYDGKVDVFSLGLILYELCTLQPIDKNIKHQILQGNIILPPHLENSQLLNLLRDMLKEDPIDRLSSDEIITSSFINFALIIYRGEPIYVSGKLRVDLLASKDNKILSIFNTDSPDNVISVLGQGGYGLVELIEKDGFQFARKTITNSDSSVKAINEVKHCHKLVHDNIVQPFLRLCSVNENDNPFIIYFEKCNGNLSSYLIQLFRQNKHFSVLGVFKIMCSLINALYWIHTNGCVHRDIKGDNVLITKDGNIVLSDLGLIGTKHQDGLYKTQIGTPRYVGPEMIFNPNGYTEVVDIYALGCLIYAICSYQSPPDKDKVTYSVLTCIDMDFNILKCYDEEPELQKLVVLMTHTDPMKRITINQLVEHPVFIKYNYITRSIPFLINDQINPQMIMELDLPLRTIRDKEFSLSQFLLRGVEPLPHSNYTFLNFPSELDDNFTIDLCYIFPTLDELFAEEQNLRVIFGKDELLNDVIKLIEKYLPLLGFRITVENSQYTIKENIEKTGLYWSCSSDVLYSLVNILAILRYFVEINKQNKLLYQKLVKCFTAFTFVCIKHKEKFPYMKLFNKLFLFAATYNRTIDDEIFLELLRKVVVQTRPPDH